MNTSNSISNLSIEDPPQLFEELGEGLDASESEQVETTKKKNAKKVYIDAEPEGRKVTIFDKRMQPCSIKFRNDMPCKSNMYQTKRHLWQDSRTKMVSSVAFINKEGHW